MESQTIAPTPDTTHEAQTEHDEPAERTMPCPVCGHPMSDLKGGKATICPVCGFKDSCCY
jgi:hypothetical protein